MLVYELAKGVVTYAYQDKLKIKEFILYFFNSSTMDRIIEYSDIVYYHPLNIYREICGEHHFKKEEEQYDYDIVKYIVYIYLAFYYRTRESFSLVISILPINDIVSYYDLYHTLDEERVIFRAKINYNLKMNALRKNRASHYRFDYSEESKNLFIAKYIYLKLFNYPEIKSLRYTYKDKIRYLESQSTSLFVSTYSNKKEIIDNNTIAHIKYQYSNNILFIFLQDDEEINMDELTLLFHSQTQIPFDKILIYKNETVAFINQGDGYLAFNIALTNLDIKKIEKDYLSRY